VTNFPFKVSAPLTKHHFVCSNHEKVRKNLRRFLMILKMKASPQSNLFEKEASGMKKTLKNIFYH